MKQFLKLIPLWLLIIPLHAANVEGKYYKQLEKLEVERLDNLSETRNRIEKLGQNKKDFNTEELDLYNLILAHSILMSGKLDEGAKILEELLNNSKDITIRGRAHGILGIVYRYKGENVKSFIHLDKALQNLKNINNPNHRTTILANTVTVYRDSDLLEFALEKSRLLLTEANKIKSNRAYCHAYLELGGIEAIAGNNKLAKQRLLLAKEHCSKLKSPLHEMVTNETLVRLDLKNEAFDEAFEKLDEYSTKVNDYGWEVIKSSYKSSYAEAYLLKGDAKKALPYALSAYEISGQYNDYKRKERATSLLAKIYEMLENKAKALQYYKEYMDINLENKALIRQRKLAFDVARRGKI